MKSPIGFRWEQLGPRFEMTAPPMPDFVVTDTDSTDTGVINDSVISEVNGTVLRGRTPDD